MCAPGHVEDVAAGETLDKYLKKSPCMHASETRHIGTPSTYTSVIFIEKLAELLNIRSYILEIWPLATSSYSLMPPSSHFSRLFDTM